MPTSPPADTLMALANALAAAIAQEFPTVEFPVGMELPVTCEWTIDALIDLDDTALQNPLVWVLDGAESGGADTHHGIAAGYEEFELLVIVQMKIPVGCDQAAFAIAMSQLTAQIRTWAVGLDTCLYLQLSDGETFPCLEVKRPVARNHEEWHHKHRFYSELLLKFRRYGVA